MKQVLIKTGYINPLVEKKKKINDSTYTIIVKPNKKTNWILIKNNNVLESFTQNSESKFNTNKNSDYIISYVEIDSFMKKLTKEIESQGYPFAKTQLHNITQNKSDTLYCDIKIDLNSIRKITGIKIRGYKAFPKNFLKQLPSLKKGANYNNEALIEESSTLNNLGFVSESQSPEVLFTKDSTIVYLYLQKEKRNTFDGLIGFDSNEEDGNLELNGYIDINLINNLNKGEQLNIAWKNDANEQSRLSINTEIPFLFNSPLGIEAGLSIFRKDSTFSNTTQKLKLLYKPSLKSTLKLGVLSNSSNYLQENITNDLLKDYKSTHFTAGYKYSNSAIENNLNPERFFFNVNPFIGSRDNTPQTGYQFRSFYNWRLNRKNYLFSNIQSEALFSENHFENEKYRFGGINSIRGFDENSLEATLYSVLNTEYRYFIQKDTYINTVFDYSLLNDDTLQSSKSLFGIGAGFATNTNLGLLKMIYALGKSNDSPFDFSDSKLHISYSNRF